MGRSIQTTARATSKSAIAMAFIKIAILLTALCGYALTELQSAETGSLASKADGAALAGAADAQLVLNKANLAEAVMSRMTREADPEAAKKGKNKKKKNKNKKKSKKLRKNKKNKKAKKGKKGKKGKGRSRKA